MTDNRSLIAGSYPHMGIKQTVNLMEGAPTVSTAYDLNGKTQPVITWAAPIVEGDWVAIANDNTLTFVASEGIPNVEIPQNGEALVVGRLTSTPSTPVKIPENTAAADSLAKRLAGKYYRRGVVEFPFWNQILKAEVLHDGANATVIGVGATLNYNITASAREHKLCFVQAGANGTGVIPLHYVGAGQAGDKSNAIVALTGPMYAVTGA